MTKKQMERTAQFLRYTKDFFDTTYLCRPYSELEQPEIPMYRSLYPTIGVDPGNIDASKEIGMLQGYNFAKREMKNRQNQQRIKYVDTDDLRGVVRYIDADIKQTEKFYKEMMNMRYGMCFEIQKVIFNAPATIVFWADGTKTVVKAQRGDKFDPEKGLAMAFSKRALGDKGNYYNVFRKHLPKAKAKKTTKKTTKKTDTAKKITMVGGLVVDVTPEKSPMLNRELLLKRLNGLRRSVNHAARERRTYILSTPKGV